MEKAAWLDAIDAKDLPGTEGLTEFDRRWEARPKEACERVFEQVRRESSVRKRMVRRLVVLGIAALLCVVLMVVYIALKGKVTETAFLFLMPMMFLGFGVIVAVGQGARDLSSYGREYMNSQIETNDAGFRFTRISDTLLICNVRYRDVSEIMHDAKNHVYAVVCNCESFKYDAMAGYERMDVKESDFAIGGVDAGDSLIAVWKNVLEIDSSEDSFEGDRRFAILEFFDIYEEGAVEEIASRAGVKIREIKPSDVPPAAKAERMGFMVLWWLTAIAGIVFTLAMPLAILEEFVWNKPASKVEIYSTISACDLTDEEWELIKAEVLDSVPEATDISYYISKRGGSFVTTDLPNGEEVIEILVQYRDGNDEHCACIYYKFLTESDLHESGEICLAD